MGKKQFDFTDVHDFVTCGTAIKSHLNPLEWFDLAKRSLAACKIVLRKAAENSRDAMTFESILNHPIKDGHYDEKRVTPKEVADTLPRALSVNDRWLFMPVKTLAVGEEKGQFFERQLFVLADYALMVIVDTSFRKEPQLNQKAQGSPPKINENVVGCQVLAQSETLGMADKGFDEIMMTYFEDPEFKLGEHIVDNFLDRAIDELRKAKEDAAKIEAAMKPFLDIRTRLGIWNHL